MAKPSKPSKESAKPIKRPQRKGSAKKMRRAFEFAPDHVMFYSDFANVISTDTAVILALYSTAPDLTDPAGAITGVTGYRKATITMSHAHALKMGEFLVKHGSQGGGK